MSASKRSRAGACSNCRIRKRRCIPSTIQPACRLCSQLSIDCSLDTTARHNNNGLDSAQTGISSLTKSFNGYGCSIEVHTSTTDPTTSLVLDLVGLYFRFIHNVSHSMFHEISFMKRLRHNQAPRLLILSMIALSARFSQDQFFSTSDPRSRGRHYASEAMQLLHQVMIVPSLETVQASIILGNYLGGEGDNRGKHIYIGIARIHAESIRLSEVPVHSTIAVKEEYRRTWLAVCIADRWSSADIGIQYALAGRKLSNFPAIDDVSFHLSSEELLIETEVLDWEHSMWVQMAGTFTIFSSINDVLRNLSHSSLSFTDYRHKVPILEKELYEWEHGLPQKLVYSIDNLNYFIDKGLGRTFLAMHIGLHHFRQILFYPFLDPRFYESTNKSREDRLAFDESAQTCKESARMVSEIAKIGFNSRGCELRYFLHGHIVVISSCIHLHTLLFNEDSNEVATARELLVSNFQLLMRMKLHWRVVDSSLARLRSFQNDCRISRSRPFVLDNWMLRFLMEHTTVLADRQTDVQQPHSRPLSPIIDQSNVTGRFTVQEQSQQNLEEHDDASPPWQTLNNLLNETNTTNDDLVDNALEWLLEN